MSTPKGLTHVKPVDRGTRRAYFRRYTGVPPELLGSKMETEKYLNALAKKTLHVTGVQPRQG